MKQSKAMILITVMIMDLLAGMEFDLFVPSFPELQGHFSLSPFLLEALLSANFIGYCISLFFVGGLADRYGRKPIILLGLMSFVCGSILCLWATSYELVLIGRFLQGVGIAAPAILSFLIIADSYPLREQQFLMSMLNGSLNTAAAVAPVIGSYVTLYFHWQGNFKLLLVLGLIAFIMTLAFIPKYKLPPHKETLSIGGYLPVLRSKPLLLVMTSVFFSYVPYWVFVGMSPLLYIKGLGVPLAHFGYYQGILALVFAVGSVLYGLIIKNHQFDQKKMLKVGIQSLIFALIILALITFLNSPNPLFITLAFLPFIIGGIIPGTILFPLALNFMPEAKARVSAIIQGGRLIFASLGLQVAGIFYEGSFRNIGIIVTGFILITVIMMLAVSKNSTLMDTLKSEAGFNP